MKKLKFSEIFSKLTILGVTGMPGLQKILILLFVGIFHSVESLGAFVSDTFTIQILAYFTAINWSSILIADINKYKVNLRDRFYASILANSFYYSVLFSTVIAILFLGGWIQDLYGSIVYLILFTLYQVWRHHLLSSHSYLYILIMDLGILAFSLMTSYLSAKYHLDLLLLMAIPYIIPVIITSIEKSIPLVVIPKLKNKLTLSFHTRALYSGFSGFSTASLSLFIAPLSFKLLSADYTSIIGFFNNIANIILLLPRSFSLYSIPVLSREYAKAGKVKEIFLKYEKSLFLMLLFISLFCFTIFIIFVFLGRFYFNDATSLPFINIICALILLTTIFSQLSLPISNLTTILRKEDLLMKVNLSALVIFLSLISLAYQLFIGIELLLCYQILLAVQHLFRYWKMRYILDDIK